MNQGHDTPSADRIDPASERDGMLAAAAAYFGDAPGAYLNLAGYAAYLDEQRAEAERRATLAELARRVEAVEVRLVAVENRLEIAEGELDALSEPRAR